MTDKDLTTADGIRSFAVHYGVHISSVFDIGNEFHCLSQQYYNEIAERLALAMRVLAIVEKGAMQGYRDAKDILDDATKGTEP